MTNKEKQRKEGNAHSAHNDKERLNGTRLCTQCKRKKCSVQSKCACTVSAVHSVHRTRGSTGSRNLFVPHTISKKGEGAFSVYPPQK